MSDIRTKFLGLAALATAFAGLSYGQAFSCALGASTNPTLRAEGETELVADATALCTGNTVITTGSVYATLSLPVTSKTESAGVGGTFTGNSDVVLQVIGATTAYYAGTVTGTSVSFSGVSYPATAFTLQISNVRVNAAGGSAPQVTEGILAQYAGVGGVSVNAPASGGPENVGYILPSLSYALNANSTNQTIWFGGTPGSSSFGTCTGQPLSGSTAPNPAFTINIKELFSGAFKMQTQENGSLVLTATPGIAATTGAATQPTELQVSLANVPAAATIYLPISFVSGGTTFTLQGSVTALTSPASLVGLATTGVFGFTPTGGVVNAVYTVTGATATGTLFSLPVYFTVAANAAPVQPTAMTVSVAYVPTAALTGPASLIPTFIASTATPINTLTVTACTTTLLFPYITNAAGFETGIAIANTTTDNLKNSSSNPLGVSSVTPTSGVCTLNFYGNTATQPTAFLTPTTLGVFSATSAPVYANTLSNMAGVPNFSGYAIASCNFLDAHGFAFIADGTLGTPNGLAEGYLAVTLPSSRAGSGDGTTTGN
jgi:hypothetical protein